MSLRVVVLGASGDTGKPLVRQAIERGHEVTAVVRDPSRMAAQPGLAVVSADVFDANSLCGVFQDHDAVVSTLGFNKKDGNEKMTLFTDSMRAILDGMARAQVKRLVTISAWYTDPANRDGQWMFDNMWSKVPGLVNTLNNEGEMEQMLVESGDVVDFTSVRAPTLTWDPMSESDICFEDGNWVSEKGTGFMSREDVARAMLTTLDNPEWRRRMVAISVKYTEEEMQEVLKRFKAYMAANGDHRAPE